MAKLIELRNVYKIYSEGLESEVRALDGVSLTIDRGEFVAIVGQSGSGKSTMMNVLGCLDVPTYGEYLLDGTDVSELSDTQLSRIRNKEIGFIFQQYNLIQTLSVQENVELPASVSLHEADPEGFTVGDMQVKPFATCHDSVGSLGYRILLPDGGELGFATDLGCYTAAVEEGLRGCGTVMLESNYDDGMILASDYPYYLKRRIQSNNGHLSNNDCSAVLPQLAASGTKQFVLGHLSQNNNMGLLAHQASEQALLQSGLSPQDFTLQVAQRSQPSTPIVL